MITQEEQRKVVEEKYEVYKGTEGIVEKVLGDILDALPEKDVTWESVTQWLSEVYDEPDYLVNQVAWLSENLHVNIDYLSKAIKEGICSDAYHLFSEAIYLQYMEKVYELHTELTITKE